MQFFCPHGSNSFSPRMYAAISSCAVGSEYWALPGDGMPFSKRMNSYTANPTSQIINGTADGAWTKMELFKLN